MSRRPSNDPLLAEALADLWSDSRERRLTRLDSLPAMVIDLIDLRGLQPALVWLMVHGDAAERRAALQVTEARADEGQDVGLAVPALLELARDDDDDDVRALAWRALRSAHLRTPFLTAFADEVERARADRCAKVRDEASAIAL